MRDVVLLVEGGGPHGRAEPVGREGGAGQGLLRLREGVQQGKQRVLPLAVGQRSQGGLEAVEPLLVVVDARQGCPAAASQSTKVSSEMPSSCGFTTLKVRYPSRASSPSEAMARAVKSTGSASKWPVPSPVPRA